MFCQHASIRGVGLNLHPEFLDTVLEEKPKLAMIQVIADNWLSAGPHHKKLEKIRQDYALSFHCVGMNVAGIQNLNQSYLARIKTLVDTFEPVHVSDHLSVTSHAGKQHHDLLPFAFSQDSLQRVQERVLQIQDHLQQTILLENLSYYLEYKSSSMTEFEFLHLLAEKTSCGFLLDLNNLWVNQMNLGKNMQQVLRDLDWKHVHEVHLAGPEKHDDMYLDTHGADVQPELFSEVLAYKKQLQAIPLFYERDTNLETFSQLMQQVSYIKQELIDA